MEKKKRHVDSDKRMRVAKACNRCKRMKIKCDGQQPCAGCVKHNVQCEFSSSSPDVLKPDTAELLSQLRTLQEKVAHLEASQERGKDFSSSSSSPKVALHQIQQLKRRRVESSTSSIHSFEPVSTIQDDSEKDQKDEIYLFSGPKWRVLRNDPSILTVFLGNKLWDELSDHQRTNLVKPRVQHYGWNLSGSHYCFTGGGFIDKQWRIGVFDNLLISEVNCVFLIDFFFAEINPLFSILHETVFKQQYKKFASNTKPQQDDRLFVALLHLVLAFSLRFREFALGERTRPGLEEEFFESAYDFISKLSFHWESFELLQAWCLIYLYLRITSKQQIAAHALTLAVKMLRGMSLEYNITEPRYETPENFKESYEKLKATRTFWCVYTLDKFYGLHSGRLSCMFCDEDVQLNYPDKVEDDWISPEAFAMLKLAIIVNKLMFFRTKNDPMLEIFHYREVEKELVEWEQYCKDKGLWELGNSLYYEVNSNFSMASVPGKTSSIVRSQLRLHYHHVCFTLRSKALYPLVGKPNIFDTKLNAGVDFHRFDDLISDIESIIHVFDHLFKHSMLLAPWYLNLTTLLMVGITSLIMMKSSLHTKQSQYLFVKCLNILSIMRQPQYSAMDSKDKGEHTVTVEGCQYKVTYADKITMCREIVWVLKLLNYMMLIKFSEVTGNLNFYTDFGSSDINKESFAQFGFKNNDIVRKELSGVTNATTLMPAPVKTPDSSLDASTNYNLNSSMNMMMDWIKKSTEKGMGSLVRDLPKETEQKFSEWHGNLEWFNEWQ